MHSTILSSAVAAILALASTTMAQTANFDPITSPTQDQVVVAGSELTINWDPSPTGYDNDTITLTLLYGADAAHLQLASVPIATGIHNYLGTHIYTVPSANLSATYGFKITLDQEMSIFQYSNPFHIVGGSSASANASAPATVTQTLAPNPTYSANATVTVTNSSSTATSTKAPTSTALFPTGSNSTTSASTSTSTLMTTTAAGASKTPASSTTSSAPRASSSSAAVANLATGGMAALGGMILAFAL